MRIGFGYDVHRLVPGRALVLGGVELEHPTGLKGHSDADVLSHAVIDSLIGAAGLGDIGRHFPPSDPAYKNISSIELLSRTLTLIDSAGMVVSNIDATVVCEAPRLAGHISEMEANIAAALKCDATRVNVKATTEEGLGFTGATEGISATAVSLIEEKR